MDSTGAISIHWFQKLTFDSWTWSRSSWQCWRTEEKLRGSILQPAVAGSTASPLFSCFCFNNSSSTCRSLGIGLCLYHIPPHTHIEHSLFICTSSRSISHHCFQNEQWPPGQGPHGPVGCASQREVSLLSIMTSVPKVMAFYIIS